MTTAYKVPECVSAAITAIVDPNRSDASPSVVHDRLVAAIVETWQPSPSTEGAPFLYDVGPLANTVSQPLVYACKRLMRAIAAPDAAVRDACTNHLRMLLGAVRVTGLGVNAVLPDEVLSSFCVLALASPTEKHGGLTPAQEMARRRSILVGTRVLLDVGCVVYADLLRAVLDIWCDSEVLGLECLCVVRDVLDMASAKGIDFADFSTVLFAAAGRRHVSHARRAALAVTAWTIPVSNALRSKDDTDPHASNECARDVLLATNGAAAETVKRLSLRLDRPGAVAAGALELWATLVNRMVSANNDAALRSAWHAILDMLPSSDETLAETLPAILSYTNAAVLYDARLFDIVSTAASLVPRGKTPPSTPVAQLAAAACASCESPNVVSTVLGRLVRLDAAHASLVASTIAAHTAGRDVLLGLSSDRAVAKVLSSVVAVLVRTVRREHMVVNGLGSAVVAALAASHAASRRDPASSGRLQAALQRLMTAAGPAHAEGAVEPVADLVRSLGPKTVPKTASKAWTRLDSVLDSAQTALGDEDVYAASVRGVRPSTLKPDATFSAETNALAAVVRVAMVAKAVLLVDAAAAKDVVRDLRRCVRNAVRDVGAVADALVEVLLMWLSRPAVIMRELADDCFVFVLPTLVSLVGKDVRDCAWLQSIMRILSAVPSSSDQEELMGAPDDDDVEMEVDNTADRPPVMKRVRTEPVSRDSESASEEEEMVDVDCADEKELAMFDAKIAAVLAARRDHARAHKMAARDLVCFKQRLLDWLPLIDREVSRANVPLYPLRLAMATAIADIAALHAPPRTKKNDDGASNKRTPIEAELVEKALGVLGKKGHLASLRVDKTVSAELDAEAAVVVESLQTLIQRSTSASCPRFRVATALFWMLCGTQLSADDLPLFWNAACAVVPPLARRGDSGPSTVLDSFLERPIASNPAGVASLLVSVWEALNPSALRPFVRVRLLRLVDKVLVRAPKAQQAEAYTLLGQCVLSTYRVLDIAPMQVAHVRDDFVALHSLAAHTRTIMGVDAWRAAWTSVVDRLDSSIANVVCKDAQQLESLRQRLRTTRILLR